MNSYLRRPAIARGTRTSHPRQGSIIVLTAVSLVIMLIFAALLVDVAWMASIQSEAQLTSDIATRGALAAFVGDHSQDSYDVRVARAQAVGETLFENNIIGRSAIDIDPERFVFGVRNVDGTFTSNEKFADSVRLDLPDLKPDGFGLFLAPLFGIDDFNTSPRSVASYSAIDVVLCVDISRSMAWPLTGESITAIAPSPDVPPHPGSRWLALVDSANTFLNQAEKQSPSLRVSLVTFGGGQRLRVDSPWDDGEARVETQFNSVGAAQNDIDTTLDFISDNVLASQTPTKEGLELTRSVFNDQSSERTTKICILLSDGAATTGSPDDAAAALAGDGVKIHTIYFTGREDGRLELEAIAQAGGGEALNAGNETELDNAFSQILRSLRVSLVE